MTFGSAAALILVDLQQDFLARPGLEPHPEAVTAAAARWLEAWRADGRPVAHVLTRVTRRDDRRMAHWKAAGLWSCEEGTAGERPPECLAPREGEFVFYKPGYLPAEPLALADWARSAGVERVVLAGTMTHACVAHLAAALMSEGLEVAWAGGALGSDRPQAAAHVRAHLAEKGVREWQLGEREDACAAGEVEAAVEAAQRGWTGSPLAWAEVRPALLAWAELLDAETEGLARSIAGTIGKPISMARDELRHAAALAREGVLWRDRFNEGRRTAGGVAVRRPLGVVAVLTPWNNPVSIPVGRIAPALAYGNAVVWKPAPAADAVSGTLMEMVRRAGLGDMLQTSFGGAETGRRLVRHPMIDAVTFSGSLERGRSVLAAASERLVPCQLEMGGNNAAVVADDADAEAAAEAVLAGAFGFAGQRCTANRRVILLPGAREAFRRRARAQLNRWAPGDPLDEACRIGPVKDEAAAERIEAVLGRAAAAGARITRASGGKTGPRWVAPALVEGAVESAEVVREETFGPVLVVQEAADWKEALRLLNGVPQGLVGSLFSADNEAWERFKTEALAGILRRNETTAGALNDLPFGGWKASGWGGAEHAEANALFFTRQQAWVQDGMTSS